MLSVIQLVQQLETNVSLCIDLLSGRPFHIYIRIYICIYCLLVFLCFTRTTQALWTPYAPAVMFCYDSSMCIMSFGVSRFAFVRVASLHQDRSGIRIIGLLGGRCPWALAGGLLLPRARCTLEASASQTVGSPYS